METVNDIFRVYAPEHLVRFGDAVPSEHRKAITALINCPPLHAERHSFAANPAACSTRFTAPAAIAIARPASITKPGSGSKNTWTATCQDITS